MSGDQQTTQWHAQKAKGKVNDHTLILVIYSGVQRVTLLSYFHSCMSTLWSTCWLTVFWWPGQCALPFPATVAEVERNLWPPEHWIYVVVVLFFVGQQRCGGWENVSNSERTLLYVTLIAFKADWSFWSNSVMETTCYSTLSHCLG